MKRKIAEVEKVIKGNEFAVVRFLLIGKKHNKEPCGLSTPAKKSGNA